MAEWWEAAPLVDEPMRPMVAHAPKSAGNWWEAAPVVDPDKGTLDEEPRTPAIGEDPRLAPDAVFNGEQTANVAGATATGLATVGPLAAGGTLARVLASPYAWGAYAGGKTLLKTGDPLKAGEAAVITGLVHKGVGKAAGGLLSRLIPKSAQTAVAEKVAPVVEEAAAPVAETVAPTVAKSVRPIPPMRDVTPNAIAARTAERQARQAEAAKAAGLDIGEVFGTKTATPIAAPAQAEQAAESALMTRLRASVMMKKNPQALTDEVVDRVVSIKQGVGKGLSAAQVAKSIEELYGFPPAASRQIVTQTFERFGLK